MSSVNIPHFDLPFRFESQGGHLTAAVVEQDTLDDVANCIQAALLTHIGWRPEAPEFGTLDLAFRLQPLDVNSIIEQLAKAEPRAIAFLQQNPDKFDELIARVTLDVSTREDANVQS